jgi:hypothetical protein
MTCEVNDLDVIGLQHLYQGQRGPRDGPRRSPESAPSSRLLLRHAKRVCDTVD